MKQLTVYCSRDLESRVVAALGHAGVEGFFRVASATGSRFLAEGQLPRTTEWDAAQFIVPVITKGQADRVIAELSPRAESCEVAPCLRIVVGPVDRVV